MLLLERQEQLALMERALSSARVGRGHSLFIGGEAGIGKTSLVETFLRSQEENVRMLWGACEALATPRPLGPFYDMAHELGEPLIEALDEGRPPYRLFQMFMDALRRADCASVLVIEDAHWADDGSADFLKFVARRIARYPALLAVTYREDEVCANHPLMRAIADVPPDHLSRIHLNGLSKQGVEQLACIHGRSIDDLHRITDGNPLLVTELLRNHEGEFSPSLQGTMLARLHRLSPRARDMAELLSVIPDRAERWVVDEAVLDNAEFLRECVDRRVLVVQGEHVRYRHELARRVIEANLAQSRRRLLHARVLDALVPKAADPRMLARLVHHADAAGDATRILQYAPLAGDEARQRGAHRQGAAFYKIALQMADRLPSRDRALLLETFASEAALSGRGDEALEANARAFEIWTRHADTFAQGANRRARFELLHISLYRRGAKEFDELAEAAVQLLEPHGASAELAKAYMNLAFVVSMRGELDEAQHWHDRAIATAERAGDDAAHSHIILQAELRKHGFFCLANLDVVERELQHALDQRDDRRAAHAYFLLAMFATVNCRFDTAERCIAAGLRFTSERDLDGQNLQLLGYRARNDLIKGDWTAAETNATRVLAQRAVPGIAEFSACMVLGTGYARRRDPRSEEFLQRAYRLCESKIVTRIAKLLALLGFAELYWLQEDAAKALEFAQRAEAESTGMRAHPWIRGQALLRLWRNEGPQFSTEPVAPPFAMQLRGDWAGAAAAWADLGCPYERAMALIDGDAAAQSEAFAILERLGATAVVTRCRVMLTARGISRIPRGPRSRTRSHPMGLTAREAQVLVLLAQGLPNAEISARLHRSSKTVAHHVSAVLTKLGARTRQQAVAIARTNGLIEPIH